MARKPKLQTKVSDELFQALVFCLCGCAYHDAEVIECFCFELKIHPGAVIAKLIERCPFFSDTVH